VPSSDRRERLLRRGLELFSSHAYDELSIDELAARTGVAKGLLYYYFGSKRGYYVAVVELAAGEFRSRTEPTADLPPLEQLQAGVAAYVAYADEHAEGYRTLMAGGIGSDPEVRAIIARERDRYLRRIAEGLGAPDAPPALRAALQGWFSSMEGVTLDWLEHRDLSQDTVVTLLLAALGGMLAAARQLDPGLAAELPRA
jgi:AcrR family transcriptional regulator